ncbi:MAG: DUF1592 domain-containing protein [Sandaracinus sp.]|nr:DUF1592 domain-containing protein [Sandaracinus sp.]
MAAGCREGGEPAGPRSDLPPRTFDAAGYYAAECAFCHGGAGQGRRGPALAPWAGARDELIASIDETMPFSDPSECTGRCAEAVADHVLSLSGELDCSAPPSAPRRLRLLTRREHAATVRDLFAPLGGGTTPSADPCTDGTTFRFTPSRAVSSVSVAGSFNGWDASAWPMRDEGGTWTLTRVVPEGSYEYKFVLDGSEWVPDPSATATTPDGFGGVNSVVVVRCGGAGPGVGVTIPDPTTGLPPETRPEAYPFDLQADDGIVTLVHATEYLSAAKRVADALGDSVAQLVPGSDRPGFVRTFGRRAFRRPLSDTEVDRYVELSNLESDENAARRLIVRGLLASPVFLYRSEVGVLDGRQYRLDGYEMASALSYGLLGTTPPDALLDAAARGELDSDEGVRRTAESLLADPRARDTLRVFARQWLGLDAIGELSRETSLATRQKLREATERFVAGVVLDGGSFEDLLTARAIPADGEVARTTACRRLRRRGATWSFPRSAMRACSVTRACSFATRTPTRPRRSRAASSCGAGCSAKSSRRRRPTRGRARRRSERDHARAFPSAHRERALRELPPIHRRPRLRLRRLRPRRPRAERGARLADRHERHASRRERLRHPHRRFARGNRRPRRRALAIPRRARLFRDAVVALGARRAGEGSRGMFGARRRVGVPRERPRPARPARRRARVAALPSARGEAMEVMP